MKLSTRSTYGMRAMLALAMHQGAGSLMVKEIAQRQHLPHTYLEQLMVILRKSNLVLATRGVHGGYVLARSASEISVAEIIEALEGPLDLSEPPSGVDNSQAEPLALTDLWNEASQALKQVFQHVTLAELVERQRVREASEVLMYNI